MVAADGVAARKIRYSHRSPRFSLMTAKADPYAYGRSEPDIPFTPLGTMAWTPSLVDQVRTPSMPQLRTWGCVGRPAWKSALDLQGVNLVFCAVEQLVSEGRDSFLIGAVPGTAASPN